MKDQIKKVNGALHPLGCGLNQGRPITVYSKRNICATGVIIDVNPAAAAAVAI